MENQKLVLWKQQFLMYYIKHSAMEMGRVDLVNGLLIWESV